MKKHIGSAQIVHKLSTGVLIGIILAGCDMKSVPKDSVPEEDESALVEVDEDSLLGFMVSDPPDSLADMEDFIESVGNPRGSCPEPGEEFYLIYDHHFAAGVPDGSLIYWADGSESFTFEGNGKVEGFISYIPGVVEMFLSSTGGSCNGSGDAKIATHINGKCTDGTLEMSISEHWEVEDIQLLCDDDWVTVPFPGSGDFNHKVTFAVMEKGGTFSVKYPFYGGQGAKTWSLTDSVLSAQIVPEDELKPPWLEDTEEN